MKNSLLLVLITCVVVVFYSFKGDPTGDGKSADVLFVGGRVLDPETGLDAVANVAVKILSFAGQFTLQNVIVFGENCEEVVKFLSPLHRSRYFRKFLDYRKKQGSRNRKELLEEFTKWLRLDTAAYLKSKKSVPQLLLFGFAKWLHLPQPDGVSIEVIEALCPQVDDSEKGQRVLRNLLADAKVVLCTLNTAGSTFLRRALGGRFNTLFLDEAAQVSSALFTVISINKDANSQPIVHSIQ